MDETLAPAAIISIAQQATESHRPDARLASPVNGLLDRREIMFSSKRPSNPRFCCGIACVIGKFRPLTELLFRRLVAVLCAGGGFSTQSRNRLRARQTGHSIAEGFVSNWQQPSPSSRHWASRTGVDNNSAIIIRSIEQTPRSREANSG